MGVGICQAWVIELRFLYVKTHRLKPVGFYIMLRAEKTALSFLLLFMANALHRTG